MLRVVSIQSLVTSETLYTYHSHGVRLMCVSILYPTRIPDSLHRNTNLYALNAHTRFHLPPYVMYIAALGRLGYLQASSMLLLTTFWGAKCIIKSAVRITYVAGIPAYIVETHGCAPDGT